MAVFDAFAFFIEDFCLVYQLERDVAHRSQHDEERHDNIQFPLLGYAGWCIFLIEGSLLVITLSLLHRLALVSLLLEAVIRLLFS